MSTKIKLFELEPVQNTRRFASQLFVHRKVADFVLRDNKMFNWRSDEFVEFNGEYEIVKEPNFSQPL